MKSKSLLLDMLEENFINSTRDQYPYDDKYYYYTLKNKIDFLRDFYVRQFKTLRRDDAEGIKFLQHIHKRFIKMVQEVLLESIRRSYDKSTIKRDDISNVKHFMNLINDNHNILHPNSSKEEFLKYYKSDFQDDLEIVSVFDPSKKKKYGFDREDLYFDLCKFGNTEVVIENKYMENTFFLGMFHEAITSVAFWKKAYHDCIIYKHDEIVEEKDLCTIIKIKIFLIGFLLNNNMVHSMDKSKRIELADTLIDKFKKEFPIFNKIKEKSLYNTITLLYQCINNSMNLGLKSSMFDILGYITIYDNDKNYIVLRGYAYDKLFILTIMKKFHANNKNIYYETIDLFDEEIMDILIDNELITTTFIKDICDLFHNLKVIQPSEHLTTSMINEFTHPKNKRTVLTYIYAYIIKFMRHYAKYNYNSAIIMKIELLIKEPNITELFGRKIYNWLENSHDKDIKTAYTNLFEYLKTYMVIIGG